MGDNPVVPVYDVESAVGPEGDRDGSEPTVVGREKVRLLRVAEARAFGRRGDDLDRSRDRVGEEEHLRAGRGGSGGPAEKPVAILRQREAAQAGAAHLGGRERRWHERLVRAEEILGTGAHPDAGRIGNDRVALIVGFLQEGLTLAARDEAPDIVGAGGEVLEGRAVGLEAGQLALIERHLGSAVREWPAVGAAHL